MRRTVIMGMTILLSTFLTITAWADDPGHHGSKGTSGSDPFYANIDLGALWMSTKSHSEAGDDNKRLNSYSQSAESESEFIPLPSLELGYHFGEGHTVYAGTLLEEELRAALGLRYEMMHGSELDVSIFSRWPDEVWEDPYLLGVDRKETDENRYGGKLVYGLANWEISYELEKVDVDVDAVGNRLPYLKRDGTIHRLETGWEFEPGSGFELTPFAGYTQADMDGESNSYKGYDGGVEISKMWREVMLQLSVEAGVDDYDKRHSIFPETRKDDTYEAMLHLLWFNPLGYDRFVVQCGVGYGKTDSNIDYYDSEETFSFFTLGYQFGGGGHGRH